MTDPDQPLEDEGEVEWEAVEFAEPIQFEGPDKPVGIDSGWHGSLIDPDWQAKLGASRWTGVERYSMGLQEEAARTGRAIVSSQRGKRMEMSEALSYALTNIVEGFHTHEELTLGDAVDILTELSREQLGEVFGTDDPIPVAGLITELATLIYTWGPECDYQDFFIK